MNKPRAIMSSNELPQNLQAEILSMQKVLEGKYGKTTHMVGAMMENLAQVCAMVRVTDMSDAQREAAWERSKDACSDVLRVLGTVLQVDPEAATAVAMAYRDFTARAEEELLGADTLQGTEGAAAEAIKKAMMH